MPVLAGPKKNAIRKMSQLLVITLMKALGTTLRRNKKIFTETLVEKRNSGRHEDLTHNNTKPTIEVVICGTTKAMTPYPYTANTTPKQPPATAPTIDRRARERNLK